MPQIRLLPRPRSLEEAQRLLFLGVIAPLLLATLTLLMVQAWQENQLSSTRLSSVADVVMQAVDTEFVRSRAQLEVLALSPSVDAQDWPALYRFAKELTGRQPGTAVVLVGPEGQQLINTSVPWGAALPNVWSIADEGRQATWEGRQLPVSSGNLSREAFERGEPVYSNLYFGLFFRTPSLAVSVPVMRGGLPRYALLYAFSPAALQSLMRAAVQQPNVGAVLLDRQGLVVAANRYATAGIAERLRLGPEADPEAAQRSFRTTASDGAVRIGALAVSRLNGFMVRLDQPVAGAILPHSLSSWLWVGLIVLAMAASVLVAVVATRRVTVPLRKLVEEVDAGREPTLEPGETLAEVGSLVRALRQGRQAERLRASEEAARLVAESRATMLREADRHKDVFLATLAHELRNPLAPIRTAAEVIRLTAPHDSRVDRARATIERQCIHLTRLVDDLLDVARITHGEIELRRDDVDLRAVAAAALEAVEPLAHERGVSLHAEQGGQPLAVRGDAMRLTQCLVNLLGNAVKFTPRCGHVGLRLGLHGGVAVIEVTDTGQGIGEAQTSRIFELFAQERISGQAGNSGLGIGLFLVRKIVDLHGGHVEAVSGGRDQGSTFRITLPLDTSAAVRTGAPANREAARASG